MSRYTHIPELSYTPIHERLGDKRQTQICPNPYRKVVERAECKGKLPTDVLIVKPKDEAAPTRPSLPTLYRIQREIALKTGGVLKP